MDVDKKFVVKILDAFKEHEDAYMPVFLLAKKVNDVENFTDPEEYNRDNYSISSKMVFHLLHLQDLGCFENVIGEFSWGYNPTGDRVSSFSELIDSSLESGEFSTPHSYHAQDEESVIRLTAFGIQMREALNSEVSSQIKSAVVNFGKIALPAALAGIIG